MPREAPKTGEDLSRPPIRRYAGPMVDAHTHTGSVAAADLLMRVARDYGIDVLCGITHARHIPELQAAFGPRYRPIVWVEHDAVASPDRFASENIRRLRDARRRGAVAAKFWYTPRFLDETGFRFDNHALNPVFETLAKLAMPALVHLADPDCWFQTRYADRRRYGAKIEHYDQLEHTLARFPGLTVIGAHLGGHPEDLDHLRRLLDAYPNYYLDSSATKWIARELSLQPDAARAFLVERSERILFGSDLVAFDDATPAHYASRWWVHRWLWEGQGTRPSPIPDPCAPWRDGPQVHGLNLPDDCLARLYAGNARRLLGVET